MFAFILFTEGFGSWKAFLSCETWKLKLLQSSLNTDMSTKKLKQYSTDPTLVSQEKSDDFEISNKILATERDTEEILLNSNSNKDSEPGELQLSTGLTSPTESVQNSSNLLPQKTDIQCHINGYNAIGNQAQELEKKQFTAKPLKVVVRRYSTKMHKRHHVEEVEADLHSEESSESDKEDVASK